LRFEILLQFDNAAKQTFLKVKISDLKNKDNVFDKFAFKFEENKWYFITLTYLNSEKHQTDYKVKYIFLIYD
jgi:hypothetical protein